MRSSAAQPLPIDSDDSWALTTRNDYVKAVHCTLLRELSVNGAREFWSNNRFERNGQALSERALAAHIWDERALSPTPWMLGLVSELERFLVDKGVNVAAFNEQTRPGRDQELPVLRADGN